MKKFAFCPGSIVDDQLNREHVSTTYYVKDDMIDGNVRTIDRSASFVVCSVPNIRDRTDDHFHLVIRHDVIGWTLFRRNDT